MEDADVRHRFYTYSNWMYQLGVFVSRSSGMLYQVGGGTRWELLGNRDRSVQVRSAVAGLVQPEFAGSGVGCCTRQVAGQMA